MAVYSYSVQNDFPYHKVDSDRLTSEIRASSITISLDYISVSGDVCDIYFKASLSGGEQTTLDGIVAAHSGEPLPPGPDYVKIDFDTLTVVDGYTTTTNTGFHAMEGTTYAEPGANGQRSLVSSNTHDSSAGTGARKVLIVYFDEDLNGPYTEEVTLNGTTAVDTSETNIAFVESMEVTEVGNQLGNMGTITMKSSTGGGGTTVGSIAQGDNETNWVHHYVPNGKILNVLSVYANAKGPYGGEAHLRRATPTVANTPEKTVVPILRVSPGAQANLELSAPFFVSGPARVTLYVKPDNSLSTDWLGGFNYFQTDA